MKPSAPVIKIFLNAAPSKVIQPTFNQYGIDIHRTLSMYAEVCGGFLSVIESDDNLGYIENKKLKVSKDKVLMA